MPFENLHLQLEADSLLGQLEMMVREYNKVEERPERIKQALRAKLKEQIELITQRLAELRQQGIRPNSMETKY